MIRKILPIFLFAALGLIVTFPACAPAEEAVATKITKLPFGAWYELVAYTVNPSVKGYKLPLPDDSLLQFAKTLAQLKVLPADPMLLSNGFILSDEYKNADVSKFFDHFRSAEVPVFITVDSVLHLYHVLYDKILADLEETTFHGYLNEIFTELTLALKALTDDYARPGARLLAIKYLAVASHLLNGVTEDPDPAISKELKLIAAHKGFDASPLFVYEEDYSQYVPRGHYTKTETLKNYFRSMMWLGRMTFLAKGRRAPNDKALVDLETAKLQSETALVLASLLAGAKSLPLYDAIYRTTSFFVGYSDDLTPYEYSVVAGKVLGSGGKPAAVAGNDVFAPFQKEIALLTPPAIYSGTGNITVLDRKALEGEPSPELLDRALNQTIGMRLMGQRFVIDSYFTGKLVFPTIGKFTGKGNPPTGVPSRSMPTAYDIMSVLGSTEADKLLSQYSMSAYANYLETNRGLQKELAELKPEDWHRNLYMAWLDTLRSLFTVSPAGYQPFQSTSTWERRQLLSSLGSWTALRHDTILYVKQSYTQRGGKAPRQKPPAAGFVEPEPEMYARLLALHRLMINGVAKLNLKLEGDVSRRCVMFDNFLSEILTISIAELEAKELSEKQSAFIKSVADTILIIEGMDAKEFTTEIVADVHTDGMTGNVLEEGTGAMLSMVVVFAQPDGTLEVAVGPVYSWYEFSQPMANRLTDEAWREILKNKPPALPSWINELMPMLGRPLPEERF